MGAGKKRHKKAWARKIVTGKRQGQAERKQNYISEKTLATKCIELGKGGKGNEKGFGQEKVGMATDSDRLEAAKH